MSGMKLLSLTFNGGQAEDVLLTEQREGHLCAVDGGKWQTYCVLGYE
jgi:hypothetical protein